MLRDFLTTNRPELIDRCRTKAAKRRVPRATPVELEHGVSLFLDQLTEMLPGGNGKTSEAGSALTESRMEEGAMRHGEELLRHDFTLDQVVHDYGDLCQSITELAAEKDAPITVHEFGILNIRLDNAIAGAVTEYARRHEIARTDEGTLATRERLGALAHEMRNHLNTSALAISAIRRGSVGFSGATAAALDRCMISMRDLIDRALVEVRLGGRAASPLETIEIGQFVAQVQAAAALEASDRGCKLCVSPVEPGILVEGDRQILALAVANLIQNAFKFTRRDSVVLLRAFAAEGRVLIEVEDECGGLPQGTVEALSLPFARPGAERSGVGLGLSISRKGVEASGGTLTARNTPGRVCVFTIDLPRKS